MQNIHYSGGLSIEEVRSQIHSDRIFKMSSNENPLGPSAQVVEAIRKAAPELNIYPPRDDQTLRQALASFHGRGLRPDHFFSAVSGVEVLEMVARALLSPEDEVIVCPPTFGWYLLSARRQGVRVVEVPLGAGSFAHDIDAILQAANERTRLVYLCNPHNPTGVMTSARQMDRLVGNLPEQVTLLADEVYHHFVERPDYPDTLRYVLAERNVLIVHSFSKAYGLAGLRLGYAIARPGLIERLARLRRPFQQSRLALEAGQAALMDQDHIARTVTLVRQGKEFLYQSFDGLGITCWPSEANFILIRSPIDGPALDQALLRRGVLVHPTDANGLPGHFRVTVGLPEANQALVTALEEILRDGI